MTSDQIVYQQRVRVLDHAGAIGNVAATYRTFGISRKTFYKWRNAAAKCRPAALMPKTTGPNATPTHIIEMLLTLAITTPTLGCGQYADRLVDQGFEIGSPVASAPHCGQAIRSKGSTQNGLLRIFAILLGQ